MSSRSNDVSQQMYHRIYRLSQQKLEPMLIAATLKLSVKTVQSVLDRLTPDLVKEIEKAAPSESGKKSSSHTQEFGIMVSNKVRFVLIDIGGPAIAEHVPLLDAELRKILQSEFKAVALHMIDTTDIDADAAKVILQFHDNLVTKNKYGAILDPSDAAEKRIAEFRIEDKIPIFGTERAFEEAAFSLDIEVRSKKLSSHRKAS